MTIIFELQNTINSGIDENLFSLEETKSLISLLESFDEVLALFDFSLLTEVAIPENIQLLGTQRIDAKINKNWNEADRIRDEIE